MRSEDEIQKAASNLNTHSRKYPGMSYEEGVRDALEWVLEQLSDDEFELETLTAD